MREAIFFVFCGDNDRNAFHKRLGLKKNGAETQICTGDARIFSPALYSLSYLGNQKTISFKARPLLY